MSSDSEISASSRPRQRWLFSAAILHFVLPTDQRTSFLSGVEGLRADRELQRSSVVKFCCESATAMRRLNCLLKKSRCSVVYVSLENALLPHAIDAI